MLESAGLVPRRREGRYKFHYLDTAPLRTHRRTMADRRTEGEHAGSTSPASSSTTRTRRCGFYTDVLGFVKKTEIPLGEARWLTVVSPDDPDGTELLLEPDGHPAVGPFKEALVEDGIPFTSFAVDDVHAEYERLRAMGVRFTQEPLEMGPVTTAVLDDTCGNLIQLASESAST